MSSQQSLSVGQLVWAKVEPYPWWPGKIVKMMTQHNTPIFKISFFNDSTYTYLHAHQLVTYQLFDQQLNSGFKLNAQHQKATKLAQNYFNKGKRSKHNAKLTEESEKIHQIHFEPNCDFKEEEIMTQNIVFTEQPTKPFQQNYTQTVTVEPYPYQNTIIQSDVFVLIQQSNMKQQKTDYCYQKRKEKIVYQNRLKEMLLKKYNLLDVCNGQAQKKAKKSEHRNIIQITVGNIDVRKEKKISKHSSIKKAYLNNQMDVLKTRCLKKLNQILKKSKDSFQNAKSHSIETMRRIQILADSNHIKLKSLFITLMKTVNVNYGSNCEQTLSEFNHYLQKMENQKHYDDEGSGMTQIQTINN